MKITFPACPKSISLSLTSAITQSILSVAGLGGTRFDTGQPHQVYYILPSALLRERSLSSAKVTAWRMTHTAFGAAFASEVDLAVNPNNENITAINQGPFASAPSEQLESLQASQPEGAFEVRLLRLPEIKLMAVWLHSTSKDVIVPVAPVVPPLVAGRQYSLDALLEVVSPAIQRLTDLQSNMDQ